VIIGAGLAGLSTAYHLEGRECVVLEKGATPGGLASSRRAGPFTFDYTGHLLHLRDEAVIALVEDLLPGELAVHSRKAAIHSRGVLTPYPFQANTHGLPPQVVFECVRGFVQSLLSGAAPSTDPELSFRDWTLQTFGEGIAEHFMFPYNRKMWLRELDQVTADWVSWAVPRPSLDEVLRGALGIVNQGMGYNPSFRYPRGGGIHLLPDRLAERVPGVRYGEEAVSIDLERRTVATSRGGTIPFSAVVNTMPLPLLLDRLAPRGTAPAGAGPALDWVDVYDLNLGVGRPRVSDQHWIYFPGPEYPFYRAGFPSNFSDAVAPEGCSSIYVEVSVPRGEPVDESRLVQGALEGLERAGILRSNDELLATDLVRIDPGYVIFDRARRRALPGILDALRQRDVLSIGRYGAWTYSYMEAAIRDGMKAAAELSGGRSR
jgi:protoporphyrinogen oxidase